LNILVTGAAGFIGSHLTEYLIKSGNNVFGIDNLSTGKKENLNEVLHNSSFKFIEGDYSENNCLEDTIPNVDVIYHLAASVGVKLLTQKPISSIENNVKGLLNLLKLTNKFDKKLFIASSSEVYGKAENGILNEKDDIKLGPPNVLRWSYGCSKALAEYLAMSYFKEQKTKVLVGRFFNICGPRQVDQYGMVVPSFLNAALKNKPITVYGNGEQVRSFTYVSDAVYAITSLIETGNSWGNVYNIGNKSYLSIMELAEKVKKVTNSNSEIVKIPYSEAYGSGFEDMKFRVPDLSKLESVIDYSPQVNIEQMLENILSYISSQIIK